MGLSAAGAQPELQSEEEAVMRALLTLRLVNTLDPASCVPYLDLGRGLTSLLRPLATQRHFTRRVPNAL